MELTSLGYRTDLMLLSLHGSQVDDHGAHLVVRSPHNPTFRWGNFVLYAEPPGPDDLAGWEETFAVAFPDAAHRAFGIDGVVGDAGEVTPFTAAGYDPDVSTVMTAEAVHEPPRPNREATYRALDLDDDADLDAAIALQMAGNQEIEARSYEEFLTARMASMRGLQRAGHGRWFGAFIGGRMLSGMGLFSDGSGLARFQSVDTHPEARGAGLAGSLVHHVSTYGFTELGARTLVMVADPAYLAIRVYRSVGFTDSETQVGLERKPARGQQA